MGLNCSHGAFDGAYSRFNRFRAAVCEAIGGTWPKGFEDLTITLPDGFMESHPGMMAFLAHSDCDDEMTPEECRQCAAEMREILPKLSGEALEHATKWITGCELAASRNEPLEFS